MDTYRLSEHLRSNAVGYVAVFLALTATATALPGRNTVGSGDIQDGAVRTGDLDRGAVTAKKIAARSIRGQHFPEAVITSRAISDSAFAAGDIARSGGKSGDAFEIAPDAITSGEINNGTIGAADVDEAGLGLGSNYAERTSSLELGTSYKTVISRSITTASATQVHAVASVELGGDANADGDDYASCQVEVDGLYRSPEYFERFGEFQVRTLSVTFGRTVFPGAHSVAVECRKWDSPNTFASPAGLIVFTVPLG